jgi:similar to stage IV sporulation protein
MSDFLVKAQIECEIIGDKGLPALLSKRLTQVILSLIIILVLSLIIISRYIWNITVTGSTYYTSEQISSWVIENAVAIGSSKKDIVCSELEYSIKEGLDEVEWVSCSIKGTTLVIDIYDSNDDAGLTDKKSSGDIIADTDCTITDIIPIAGTALVAVGDKVKRGDVLISGEITITNDYGEAVDTAYVDAMGYVTGLITETFNETIAHERQEKLYTESFKSFAVGFGDAYIDIFTPKIKAAYDVERKAVSLSVGNAFYLPFSVATYDVHPYSVSSVENDEQELREIMSKRVDAYIGDLQKKGVEIVENNVKMYVNTNGCTAKGTILYRKTIGYKGD